MRPHRVRFVPPKRVRATKRLNGTETCLPSPAGRAELQSRKWAQWRAQSGVCADCHTAMDGLSDAKFRQREFREGVENPLVHKRCPK